MSALKLATWLIQAKKGAFFWIVAGDYELARPECLHLIEHFTDMGLMDAVRLFMPEKGGWTLWTRGGVQIQTKTSADVLKLAGKAPDGVLLVEAAQQSEETYMRCRGRVLEKRGPMLLSGTIESSNSWFTDLWYKFKTVNEFGGKSYSLPTWSNTDIFPGGREDPAIKAMEAIMTEDLFMERYGAIPCKPSNVVMREFDPEIHVKPCPFDPSLPVHLAIDPGYAGAYSVNALQRHDNEEWVLDEIYWTGRTVHDVIAEAKRREWWPKVTFGVIDIAGRQHHGDDSQVDVWAQETHIPMFYSVVPILAGIQRYRTFLKDPATGKPRLFYDNVKCPRVIGEHLDYRYNRGSSMRDDPRREVELPIDAFNHGVKAVLYLLTWSYGIVPRMPLAKVSFNFKSA